MTRAPSPKNDGAFGAPSPTFRKIGGRTHGLRESQSELWPRFGWTQRTRAALPFWHLASSGLWVLHGQGGPLDTRGMKPPANVKLARWSNTARSRIAPGSCCASQTSGGGRWSRPFISASPRASAEELRLELGLPPQPATKEFQSALNNSGGPPLAGRVRGPSMSRTGSLSVPCTLRHQEDASRWAAAES